MKIRTDYVTNSSSSSFIVAREEELSETVRNIIVDFVTERMLGHKLLTPDSSEEQIQKAFEGEYFEKYQDTIRKMLKEGKTVYSGRIRFEDCEYQFAELFEELWSRLEKESPEEITIIDGDLSY